MENVTIGFIGLGVGLLLVRLRVQIGVALGAVSFFGIALIVNLRAAWGIVTAVPSHFVGACSPPALPLLLPDAPARRPRAEAPAPKTAPRRPSLGPEARRRPPTGNLFDPTDAVA